MSSVNAYVQSFRVATVTTAILQAATNASPGKELFRDVVIGGRPLGDINNTGTVTSADALDYQKWGQGTLADPGFTYVETVLNPYMTQNPVAYAAYLAFGYGQVGAVTMTGDANVSHTGVQAPGQVGSVAVSGDANTSVTGVTATGNVGSVTVDLVTPVPVTGVSATGQVGSVATTADANVFPTGVTIVGFVGGVLVWGPIDDGQTPNWAPVDDSQSSNWTVVNDSQSVNWVEVVT